MKAGNWSPKSTIAMVLATPFVGWIWLGIVEWITLSDATPENHITASFRRALSESPDLFLILMLATVAVNAAAVGVIVGHIWNQWGRRNAGD